MRTASVWAVQCNVPKHISWKSFENTRDGIPCGVPMYTRAKNWKKMRLRCVKEKGKERKGNVGCILRVRTLCKCVCVCVCVYSLIFSWKERTVTMRLYSPKSYVINHIARGLRDTETEKEGYKFCHVKNSFKNNLDCARFCILESHSDEFWWIAKIL